MKNFFLFLLAFIVGAFSIFTIGVFALTKSPVDDWEGIVRLEIINPDVSVKELGKSTYRLLNKDMTLEEGDSVKTGPEGAAEIIIADGSVIRVAADTELVINRMNLESLWKQDVNVSLNKLRYLMMVLAGKWKLQQLLLQLEELLLGWKLWMMGMSMF